MLIYTELVSKIKKSTWSLLSSMILLDGHVTSQKKEACSMDSSISLQPIHASESAILEIILNHQLDKRCVIIIKVFPLRCPRAIFILYIGQTHHNIICFLTMTRYQRPASIQVKIPRVLTFTIGVLISGYSVGLFSIWLHASESWKCFLGSVFPESAVLAILYTHPVREK